VVLDLTDKQQLNQAHEPQEKADIKPRLTLASRNGVVEAGDFIEHIRLVRYERPSYMELRSPGMLNEAMQKRHQVFCEIKKWEKESYTGIETDEFDAVSDHYVLVGTGKNGMSYPLSYVRFVHVIDSDEDNNPRILPVQRSVAQAGGTLSPKFEQAAARGTCVEISRLLANPNFNNTIKVAPFRMMGMQFGEMKVKASELLLHLALEDTLERHQHVKYMTALLKDDLCANIKRFAFGMKRVGDTIEHRGARMPITVNPHTFRNRVVRKSLKDFFASSLEGKLFVISQKEVDGCYQELPAFNPELNAVEKSVREAYKQAYRPVSDHRSRLVRHTAGLPSHIVRGESKDQPEASWSLEIA